VRAKSFYNSFTIFSRRLPDEGPQNISTIFLQFSHNFSLLAVYPSEETKILRRFCGRIVETFVECRPCCPYTQLMLFHAAVQKIYRNREYHVPIPYLLVPPSTVAT
jgi:hypothetical protein